MIDESSELNNPNIEGSVEIKIPSIKPEKEIDSLFTQCFDKIIDTFKFLKNIKIPGTEVIETMEIQR